MGRYSLGLDFGTESVRALLVNLDTGEELGEQVFEYPDGVIDRCLPTDSAPALGHDWFLQNPQDYLTGLQKVVPAALSEAGVDGSEVVGIGMDFTACTVMPTDGQGVPLCVTDRFRENPHAWVKLWKHHGAAAEADHVTEVARERREEFLNYYGGKLSSEWFIPKVLETLKNAPEVYDAADTFVEGADWVAWQLTGRLARNTCCAGYKAQYVDGAGWPSGEFMKAVHPRLADLFEEKVHGQVMPAGTAVGGLTEQWAGKLSLRPGTPVSAGIIDAHAGMVGCGATGPGRMAVIMGTSFCHLLLSERCEFFEGVAALAKNGIVRGYYGYESGQTAGGDIYAWFVNNCVPAACEREAQEAGRGVHELLSEKAARLRPGQSGLLALDWWNGNRSILMDPELSGTIIGLTLDTGPEEIYRALIEGTAFGTRRILQSYLDAGLEIEQLVACGGIPEQNPLAMQVFADVCNLPIHVAASHQATALGAALFGAAAAGKEGGGFDTVQEAAGAVVQPPRTAYRPDADAAEAYDELYREYVTAHDYFGRRERLMHRLRRIKRERSP